MSQLMTNAAITVTVTLPGRDWPEVLKPPAHRSGAAVRILRGCLAGDRAVMVLRVEGSSPEIDEALLYWKRRAFAVKEGDHSGLDVPPRASGDRRQPFFQSRGNPFRNSRDLVSTSVIPAM